MHIFQSHPLHERVLFKRCAGFRCISSKICKPVNNVMQRNGISRKNSVYTKDIEAQKLKRQSICRAQSTVLEQKSPGSGDIFWKYQWYPVQFIRDLDNNTPTRVTLLDTQLVVWFDPVASAWSVLGDVCPHRLVPLSEGRINEAGQLECPYHGWAFNGEGRCCAIPHQGDPHKRQATATTYPSTVYQGILWVRMAPLSAAYSLAPSNATEDDLALLSTDDLPPIPEADVDDWAVTETFRDLPHDFVSLLENAVDVSHLPFTHHATISKRERAQSMKLNITNQDTTTGAFTGEWSERVMGGTQITRFQPPCTVVNTVDTISSGGAYEATTIIYAVPTTPGRCRCLSRVLLKFKSKVITNMFGIVPRWLGHVMNHTPFEDDVVMLHLQDRRYTFKRFASGDEAPTDTTGAYQMDDAGDIYVKQLHNWFDSMGGGPFGVRDFTWLARAPPTLPPTEAVERYKQHTANCPHCLAALSVIGKVLSVMNVGCIVAFAGAITSGVVSATGSVVKVAAGGGGLLATAGSYLVSSVMPAVQDQCRSRVLVWSVVCVACVFVRQKLLGLQRAFYQGNYPPPRNALTGKHAAG